MKIKNERGTVKEERGYNKRVAGECTGEGKGEKGTIDGRKKCETERGWKGVRDGQKRGQRLGCKEQKLEIE